MVNAARTTSSVLFHMTVAFGVMWAVTGSPAFGGIAALIEPVCIVALAPLHEKAWALVERRLAGHQGSRNTHASARAARIPPAALPTHG